MTDLMVSDRCSKPYMVVMQVYSGPEDLQLPCLSIEQQGIIYLDSL